MSQYILQERIRGFIHDVSIDLFSSESKNNITLIHDGKLTTTTINHSQIILSYSHVLNNMEKFKEYKMIQDELTVYIYISADIHLSFLEYYRYYISENIFNYDNLIHLTLIVKNAGHQFKKVLIENLPFIDRWTILDTGSTDETISIVKEVLQNKKGKLYEEPFKGFRDSRNRCLDLASDTCTFNIMLDDTYILKGDIRKFLTTYRFYRKAESFSIYIKTDIQYLSNRITFSDLKLRYIYSIHEVIQNNKTYMVPENEAYITENEDPEFLMRERTNLRKDSDLKLLLEEHANDPTNPRHIYYIAETYLCCKEYQSAFDWYKKRSLISNPNLLEEDQDGLYKMAFLSQILKDDWSVTHQLYLNCFNFMPSRPESMYMLGDYYINQNQKEIAFVYLSKAFECLDNISMFQMNNKHNMYNNFIPHLLLPLCFERNINLGLKCCSYLLKNSTIKDFKIQATQWKIILNLLLKVKTKKVDKIIDPNSENKKTICWLMDGEYDNWDASTMLTKGIGGSKTFIIKYSRHLSELGYYNVVFCNCKQSSVHDNVAYYPIDHYYTYCNQYIISYSIINRNTEYLPVNYYYNIPTYLILHDLCREMEVVVIRSQLLKVFAISEWHQSYIKNLFSILNNHVEYVSYGISPLEWKQDEASPAKEEYTFIYSSFPNRGLIHLLRLFPKIKKIFPQAHLNIFCDLDHHWVQNNYSDEMKIIKQLIIKNKNYVTNHGLVNSETLKSFWIKSDVWLYPCDFIEACCLPAYECAWSKTLAVTNHTGSLSNSVADRGVIISSEKIGSDEWEQSVLENLILVLSDKKLKQELIDKNWNWINTKTYPNIVKSFTEKYIT